MGRPEKRSISYQTLFASGQDLPGSTVSGVPMTEELAIKVVTVWACVRLLADTMSTLPVEQMIRAEGHRRPFRPRQEWIDVPDPADPTLAFSTLVSQIMVSLCLDGNAFLHTVRDSGGEILSIRALSPRHVQIGKDNGTPYYTFDSGGDRLELSVDECLHIPLLQMPGALRGLSPIDQCREALGLTVAGADFQGRFFSQGTSTTGIIEYPGDMTADQVQALSDHWKATHTGRRNAHAPAVLTGGAKFTALSLTADQIQLLQLRQFQRSEICGMFRVPSVLVQDNQPGAVSYASVEQQALAFEKHTIRPFVQLLEKHLSRLTPDRSFIRFNMEGLLRGDQKSRFDAYATALNNGWMNVNEIRSYEDLRPVPHESANVYRMPLNLGDQEAATVAVLRAKAAVAAQLVASGFEPEQAAELAGLKIDHTGIPPTALQALAQLDPADPMGAYLRHLLIEEDDD